MVGASNDREQSAELSFVGPDNARTKQHAVLFLGLLVVQSDVFDESIESRTLNPPNQRRLALALASHQRQ